MRVVNKKETGRRGKIGQPAYFFSNNIEYFAVLLYHKVSPQIVCGLSEKRRREMKREDIRIRDSFVLAKNGIYYIYSSTCSKDKTTVEVYKSRDLDNWDEPKAVYKLKICVNY